MELSRMSSQQLAKWTANLERAVQIEENPKNKELYQKWLDQARTEKDMRILRKNNYLQGRKWND